MRKNLFITIILLVLFAAIAIAWLGSGPRNPVAVKIDADTAPSNNDSADSGKKLSAGNTAAQRDTPVAQHQAPAVPDLVYLVPSPSIKPMASDISIAQFAKDYDALARAAEAGNADAARKIVDALSNCDDMPMDQADLDGRLAEIARDGAADDPAVKRSMQYLSQEYQRCSALTPEQRSSYKYWLRRSAELGDADARLRYVSGGAPEGRNGGKFWADLKQYRETATAYLDAEIAAGNTHALLAASHQYGEQERYKLYQPDRIKAYAYRYAYLLAMGNAEGSAFFVDNLILTQQGMSPEEIARATALGKQIFQECCSH